MAEREGGGGPRQQQFVDDPRVDGLGDLDERHLAAQFHQRDRALLGGPHERGRQRPRVPAAKLDGQARHADVSQRRDVPGEFRGRVRQRDPGGEHQLAAAQQPPDVGQLDRVHPADGHVEPPGARHHVRRAAADDVEVKHLTQGKRHCGDLTTCKESARICGSLSLGRHANRGQTETMSDLYARHRAVIPTWVGVNYSEPIEIVGGKGCRVTDSQGNSYLDFFAGILTNMLGYDVAEVREAVERQIATGVYHTSTLYLIRSQVELAEKIAKLSGIPDAKVFFTNSGSEANEAALAAALSHRQANQVLAMRGSYHGRTFGTVAITGNASWKASSNDPFGTHYLHGTDRELAGYRNLGDEDFIAACVADLRALLTAAVHPSDVGALIAEPIQGVGGFTMAPTACSRRTRKSSTSTASSSSPTRCRPAGAGRARRSGASRATASPRTS